MFFLAKVDIRKAVLKYGLIESLKSDHIVNYYDAWMNLPAKSMFVRMELCHHGDLTNVIDKKPQVFGRDRNQTMNSLEYFISYHIFKELTEALQYLQAFAFTIAADYKQRISADQSADNRRQERKLFEVKRLWMRYHSRHDNTYATN